MNDRLRIPLFSVLVCSFFGLVDYYWKNLQEVQVQQAATLPYMFSGLFWGQLVYIAAGAVFGSIFLLMHFILTAWLKSDFEKRQDLFGAELGILAAIFSFLVMITIAPNSGKWWLFVHFSLLGILAMLVGYGTKKLWDGYLEKFLGGPLPGMFIVLLSFLLALMLMLLWIERFPLYDRAKLFMCVAAGALFIAAVWLGRTAWRQKSRGLIPAYLVFILAGLGLPFYGHRSAPAKSALGKPGKSLNIILIIGDACRADGLGIYSGKNQTPNLDRLAREGILFKRAYSQGPWTLPSVFSMATSLYPSIFQSRYRLRTYYGASEKMEPFAERLHRYGYHSGVITANSNYELGNPALLLQGFDQSAIVYSDFQLQRTRYYPILLKCDYLARRFLGRSLLPDAAAMVTEKSQAFLDHAQNPFLLWIHYSIPHDPYNPPARLLKDLKYNGQLRLPFYSSDPFHLNEDASHPQESEINLGLVQLDQADRQFVQQLYLGNVRYLDEKIGGLLKTVKAQGLEKNTVVIFTGDHGEEFWEHGQMDHGQSLYDELVHVPLIIWGAGIRPGIIEEQVALIDLVPTLAEMIGIQPNPLWQGKSLEPLLVGGRRAEEEAIYSEGTIRPEQMKAIRLNGYKLIVGWQSGRHWLFNLNQDPGEQNNIYAEDLPIAKELQEKLNLWQARNLLLSSQLRSREMSPEARKAFENRLRALGYIK